MGKPLTDYDNPWKEALERYFPEFMTFFLACLLYTSDAADERSSVDLGGRRIIKKKKYDMIISVQIMQQ